MESSKIYGLIGYPIKHSFSPAMHNAAFRALDINAEYKLFEVPPGDLGSFIQQLQSTNICGLNVTVPHKEKVINFIELDEGSFHLKCIKAVNTIINEGGVWRGLNTDISGFERALQEHYEPAQKKVALLGAGGAARAVSYVLARCGAKEIAVYDIDHQKSKNVTAMIKTLFSAVTIYPVPSLDKLDITHKDILINATPIGLAQSDPLPVPEEMLGPHLFVYDLIYNPPQTKLLTSAKKAGAPYANGLGMLLYQGVLSFEHFTKKQAPLEVMREALMKELEEL